MKLSGMKQTAIHRMPLVTCLVITLLGCNSEGETDLTGSSVETGQSSSATLSETAVEASVFDSEAEIDRAARLAKAGKTREAADALQRVLLTDPTNVEVLFRLAQTQADFGDFESAIELLDSIPLDDPNAGLPALGQSADWSMASQQYDEAENRYKRVLAAVPSAVVAHRQLAFLYNRQGRRHEAAVHLRTLCRLGDVRQDELHALLVLGHAIFEDPETESNASRRYLPIGSVAEARMLATASRFPEAVAVLDETIRGDGVLPSVMAFYGLLAIEAQDDQRFQWWLANVDTAVQDYSEYWAAIGASLVSERRFDEAVHALLNAIDRDPTDLGSMRRINQALQALGRTEEAERWVERYVTQRNATLASNAIGEAERANSEDFETVAQNLEKLGRPLEAVTWRLFGAFYREATEQDLGLLNDLRKELASASIAFPNQEVRLERMSIDDFEEPKIEKPSESIASLPPANSSSNFEYPRPKFENVSERLGLGHTYLVSSEPQAQRFALYQSLGGGAAALDYDLDGHVDLYLAQGGTEPPAMRAAVSNLFFRQVDKGIEEVGGIAGVSETLYTIGVTAGDWNQDGFQDLVLANIGNKVLLINNGDGTFQQREFDLDPDNKNLVSSVAMGDISGDAIPDLVSLYYVEDKEMLKRPELNEDGNVLTVSPASFVPGIDRLTINDGRGGLETRRISDSKDAASTGLGVVIADWNDQPGNEIFIGNDIRANHLWVRPELDQPWKEIAALTGCAHGYGGIATASMGIAAADFDSSGTLDLHIANFYLEPVSFFINRGGAFEDRAIQYKLHQESLSVLGFGCQAIDYNNDGKPDLAVTNGNIEKAPGEPLEQPPQFFVNLGSEFRLLDVEEPAGYWQGKYLGRGMARLDFNRDGQMDLVITHLGSPTALLLNQTDAGKNWLQVQLVGTRSERDAIGAKVSIVVDGETSTRWLVGGDGYLCRNEPTLHFGVGEATAIEKIEVTWPSGEVESFGLVEVNQRLLLIEGAGVGGLHRQR